MADKLALEHLFDAVRARFAAEGTAAENVFGWREPAQHPIGARIAWIPGDPAGNLGAVLPARDPGRNPRSLATLQELFTVEIATHDDGADPENERAQYNAVRLLRDAWHRAVHLAAHGTFAIRSEQWLVEKKERRYGAAIRVLCTIDSMVPDVAHAPVDASAVLDVHELDATDQLEIPEPEEEPDP